MNEVHVKMKGSFYRAELINEDPECIQLSVTLPGNIQIGDEAILFHAGRNQRLRIIHRQQNRVMLTPIDSEIFNIYPQSMQDDDSAEGVCKSYKLNSFATISREQRTLPVRVVSISRVGIGFVVNDLSIQFHTMYNSVIACGEYSISPVVVVKYAHLMEKSIRYCADIKWISDEHLNLLRYFLASNDKSSHIA